MCATLNKHLIQGATGVNADTGGAATHDSAHQGAASALVTLGQPRGVTVDGLSEPDLNQVSGSCRNLLPMYLLLLSSPCGSEIACTVLLFLRLASSVVYIPL